MKIIDLRSDTVTRPTAAMREAMLQAEVGDDVFGEDPTVNRLQVRIAAMFGKEASLFVPSGVMGNEVCIKTHTQPGDEIIVEQDSHIFVYETAAPAALSGVLVRTIPGVRGTMTAEQVESAIRTKAYYLPKTKLVCIENTHGRSGGTVIPLNVIREIREVAQTRGISVHLDGSRLWNASVASGVALSEYGKYFDSISVCLSKGLGAPIGSVIIGTREFIERARIYRKMFGGGMRQVGILAAAGLYALDHHVDRLKEDHEKAKLLAKELSSIASFKIDIESVQTNIVIAYITSFELKQAETVSKLQSYGILLLPERHNGIRAVTHLDVSTEDIQQAVAIFQQLFK